MPLCKALKAIHNTFMRPHNHLQVVCLQHSNHVITRPSQTRGLSCRMCRAHTAFKCLQARCIILKGVCTCRYYSDTHSSAATQVDNLHTGCVMFACILVSPCTGLSQQAGSVTHTGSVTWEGSYLQQHRISNNAFAANDHKAPFEQVRKPCLSQHGSSPNTLLLLMHHMQKSVISSVTQQVIHSLVTCA